MPSFISFLTCGSVVVNNVFLNSAIFSKAWFCKTVSFCPRKAAVAFLNLRFFSLSIYFGPFLIAAPPTKPCKKDSNPSWDTTASTKASVLFSSLADATFTASNPVWASSVNPSPLPDKKTLVKVFPNPRPTIKFVKYLPAPFNPALSNKPDPTPIAIDVQVFSPPPVSSIYWFKDLPSFSAKASL